MSTTTTPSADSAGIRVALAAATHVGSVRKNNEDALAVTQDLGAVIAKQAEVWQADGQPFTLGSMGALLLVADGMGGENAGEVASSIAIDSLREVFSDSIPLQKAKRDSRYTEFGRDAITAAHQQIAYHASTHPDTVGMGTTAILAWVFDAYAAIAWAGDSRAYVFNPETGLRLLTDDHSLVWELVLAGRLSPEQAEKHPDRNIITQCLGDARHPPKPDAKMVPLRSGDRFMLCSDGLNSMLTDREIEAVFKQHSHLGPQEMVQTLIDAANEAGGYDNITIALLDVIEAPEHTRETDDDVRPERPMNTVPQLSPSAAAHDSSRTIASEPQANDAGPKPGWGKGIWIILLLILLGLGILWFALTQVNQENSPTPAAVETEVPISEPEPVVADSADAAADSLEVPTSDPPVAP
jgi:protein phosphatase